MKEHFGKFFIQNTLAGLIAFLPFGAILFLLVHAYRVIHRIGQKMAGISDDYEGSLLVITILVILFMLGFFFFFGWFILPRTKGGASGWLEENFLSYVPGYLVVKGMVTGIFSKSDQLRPALLRRSPGVYAFVLVVEALPDNRFSIYLPEVPEFNRGTLLVVGGDLIEFIPGKFPALKDVVEAYGYGTSELLAKKQD